MMQGLLKHDTVLFFSLSKLAKTTCIFLTGGIMRRTSRHASEKVQSYGEVSRKGEIAVRLLNLLLASWAPNMQKIVAQKLTS